MKRNSKNGGITLRLEWGDEIHELEVSQDEWDEICSGKKVILDGPGYYYEGKFFDNTWHFNCDPVDTLIVTYGDDGGTGFIGTINDAIIK